MEPVYRQDPSLTSLQYRLLLLSICLSCLSVAWGVAMLTWSVLSTMQWGPCAPSSTTDDHDEMSQQAGTDDHEMTQLRQMGQHAGNATGSYGDMRSNVPPAHDEPTGDVTSTLGSMPGRGTFSTRTPDPLLRLSCTTTTTATMLNTGNMLGQPSRAGPMQQQASLGPLLGGLAAPQPSLGGSSQTAGKTAVSRRLSSSFTSSAGGASFSHSDRAPASGLPGFGAALASRRATLGSEPTDLRTPLITPGDRGDDVPHNVLKETSGKAEVRSRSRTLPL